jgi:hypothetical protein
MPTETIVPGAAQTIAANTVYALPVGPYRVQADGIITFSSTVGGSYATLTGANAIPGVLTNGGFIQAAGTRLVVAKKVNQLIKSYANLVGRANPLSYWRLGEQSGNTIYDWIGQNHLTKGSAVVLGTAGPLGDNNYAATLDGTINSVCSLAGVNSWSGGTALSFEAWVYNPAWAAGHEMVISLGGQGLYMSFDGAKIIMSIFLAAQFTNTATPANALVANTWYHVATTWESGDQIRLYVNGVALSGDTPTIRTGTLTAGSANINLGAFNGTSLFWSGILDDVALYMRKLTATEIYNHYAARLVS